MNRTMTQFYEIEGRGIPIPSVRAHLNFCQYGSPASIGAQLLCYTGCRIAELNQMKRSKILGNWIYWKTAKAHNKYRKEYLPDAFLQELQYHWSHYPVKADQVSLHTSESCRRMFNKEIRPCLGPDWNRKVTHGFSNFTDHYELQLNGYRKNFATLIFYYYWKKYDDADVAVLMTAKRMRHSSKHMTATHYIETLEQIEAEKYIQVLPFQQKAEVQRRILDFGEIDHHLAFMPDLLYGMHLSS